jgi:hypothetical protein
VQRESVKAGGAYVEVARVRITDAGRQAIEGECSGDCSQTSDSTSDLASEILSACTDCRALTPGELGCFNKHGIPSDALAFNQPRKHFKVLAAPIVRLPADRFEFAQYHRGDEKPVNAAIIVCRNELDDLADIAAWVPAENETALWLGRVAMLGQENTLAPRLGDPLFAYPSPREWLARRRDGVVILNPVGARSLLRAASPIAVPSIEFGQSLREALAAPLPRILVDQVGGLRHDR